MKRRIVFLLGTLLFGVLFFAFTLAVRADLTRGIDFDLTVKIQNNTPHLLDAFFAFFSSLSRFEAMLVIVLIAMLVSRTFTSVIGFIGFVALHVVGLFGKLFLTHPAPPHMFYRGTPTEFIFPGSYVQTESSYPSGHSMRVVYVGILLAGLIITSSLSKAVKITLISVISIIVVLTLFTRVSLGEHWPSDVIGGALWGATLGSFIFFCGNIRIPKKNHKTSTLRGRR